MKDARTIPPEELFSRRKLAIKLHKKGFKQKEIASLVEVHRNIIGQWIKVWKTDGINGLKVSKGGRPIGSGRILFPHEEDAIKKAIVDNCPEQLKLDFALWTREAVKLLIEEKFNIKIALRTTGSYLKKWGFTPQKPINRVYQRNEAHVQKWLQEEYPNIKMLALKDNAEIHWGDETGLKSEQTNGRSYSPKGKTPIRLGNATREKINMISSVTNSGKLRFMFYKENMTSDLLIKFMKKVIKSTSKKVYLILDNLRVHHSKKVNEFLTENAAFIKVFYLPSYSPELNPDELLNNDLKKATSAKPSTRRKGRLEKSAKSYMWSIQKKPLHIKNFFKAKNVQYAS